MTETDIHINHSISPDHPVSNSNDPQNTAESNKDHSEPNGLGTADKNKTQIHTGQSSALKEASADDTKEKNIQLIPGNQSSESSETTSTNTDEMDVQFDHHDLSPTRVEASTATENPTTTVDIPLQSFTNSNELLPIDKDHNHNKDVNVDFLSQEQEMVIDGNNEQDIKNSSNETNSPQTDEGISRLTTFGQEEKESRTSSITDKPTGTDEIQLSFKEDDAVQDVHNDNNGFSEMTDNSNNNRLFREEKNDKQIELGQINDQSNQLITSTPELINNSKEETARENNIPLAGDKHFDDPEGNHPGNPGPAPVYPSPNHKTLTTDLRSRHPACQFRSDKPWLNLQYHDASDLSIKKPNEIENEMDEPPVQINEEILDGIQGSLIGMALGDALGAHVEFRPRQYMVQNPVKDLEGGGTWGLEKGQFTDDTSMALCLANSLVARRGFVPYDQLVRYKWWSKSGYMSSTGHCFDIGAATRDSIQEFERRQKSYAKKFNIPVEDMDYLSDPEVLKQIDVYCSEPGVAGNGALMRLTPVPLFFFRHPASAVELSGRSGQITHGDQKAYDACRYYGALIVAALRGYKKDDILANDFYSNHKDWFGENELHPDVKSIGEGSYKKKNGYEEGIRGKGYIVNALEAALWAFWDDENSFEKGALAAVNLGDDTDTTAAIYGQLAGAYYGYRSLPQQWLTHVYAKMFMIKLSKWIAYEGECWQMHPEASVPQPQKGSS